MTLPITLYILGGILTYCILREEDGTPPFPRPLAVFAACYWPILALIYPLSNIITPVVMWWRSR